MYYNQLKLKHHKPVVADCSHKNTQYLATVKYF